MKFNVLLVMSLLISASAFAGQKAPRTPFESLLKDAKDSYDTMTDTECRPDCIPACFTFEQKPEGLLLSAHDRELAEVVVPASAKISLHEKRSSDGSFQREYVIAGIGTVTITYADDAYYSVAIDDGNQTENCIQEY